MPNAIHFPGIVSLARHKRYKRPPKKKQTKHCAEVSPAAITCRSRVWRFQAPSRDFPLNGAFRISLCISRARKSPTTGSKKAKIGFSSTQLQTLEGDTTMITKTALIAVLTLGTVAVASASEFDGNLQNRYPQTTQQSVQSRNVALTGGHAVVRHESYIDRASQSFSGGY
jgi:hypothetical protein